MTRTVCLHALLWIAAYACVFAWLLPVLTRMQVTP